jgi:hypothetical protein
LQVLSSVGMGKSFGNSVSFFIGCSVSEVKLIPATQYRSMI